LPHIIIASTLFVACCKSFPPASSDINSYVGLNEPTSPLQHMKVSTMAEQQLREKIASQKASIVNLPTLRSIVEETGLTSPETKARAQLIKELSDNEEQLELLIESKRVAAVVRLQDELHPPLDSDDCPICLETVKHVNFMTISRFGCCGGLISMQTVQR